MLRGIRDDDTLQLGKAIQEYISYRNTLNAPKMDFSTAYYRKGGNFWLLDRNNKTVASIPRTFKFNSLSDPFPFTIEPASSRMLYLFPGIEKNDSYVCDRSGNVIFAMPLYDAAKELLDTIVNDRLGEVRLGIIRNNGTLLLKNNELERIVKDGRIKVTADRCKPYFTLRAPQLSE